jgi:tetratricopeptide (TPR) repeat protein
VNVIFKKTLSYSLPILITAVLLGCLELGLRMFNRSLANPFVAEIAADSVELYQVNRKYLKKYFPTSVTAIPELKPELFRKHKNKKQFRIMCLGESSMLGTPYQMTCTIPAILRKELARLFPDYEFEVVNLGASAINSNVIVDLVKEAIEYSPDLVIVYMGHNDFYGPDGVGASFFQNHVPSTIQLGYKLRELSIVQLVRQALSSPVPPPNPDAGNNLMMQVSQQHMVSLQSSESRRIIQLFAHNLTTVIQLLRDHTIPLIVGDVTSNLDFPPFISDTLKGMRTMDVVQKDLSEQYAQGHYQSLEQQLFGYLLQDSTNALANYWLGKVYLARGMPEEGRRRLMLARDNDLLKFRAPSVIDTILRRICMEEQVPLVSIDSLFAASTKSGIAGNDLFWEHLHPNPRGYYLIATAFLQKLLDLNLGALDARYSMTHVVPFDYDSLGICWLELAYGDLSIKHLTSQWPFSNYLTSSIVFDTSDAELQRIARETYNRSIVWEEGCYRSAQYFWRNGKLQAARTTYQALVDDNPMNYYASYLMGNLLVQLGEKASAAKYFENSIRVNARYLQPHLDLGLLRINEGKFDDAIRELSVAFELGKDKQQPAVLANIKYGLSAAYANKGDFDRSLQNINDALTLVPNYADALSLRAHILQQMGR